MPITLTDGFLIDHDAPSRYVAPQPETPDLALGHALDAHVSVLHNSSVIIQQWGPCVLSLDSEKRPSAWCEHIDLCGSGGICCQQYRQYAVYGRWIAAAGRTPSQEHYNATYEAQP